MLDAEQKGTIKTVPVVGEIVEEDQTEKQNQ